MKKPGPGVAIVHYGLLVIDPTSARTGRYPAPSIGNSRPLRLHAILAFRQPSIQAWPLVSGGS